MAIVFIFASLIIRENVAQLYEQTIADEDKFYLPPASWLQVFSLGYNEAMADLIWVKTVVYFAESAKKNASNSNKKSTINHTSNYISTVISLDPKFLGAYKNGARLIIYHEGEISKKTILMSMDILEKGTIEFPNNGEIFFNLGFLYYWEIIPFLNTNEEKKSAKKKGAKLIKMASTMPDVPYYTGMLARTLLTQEGLDDLVIEHLKTMLAKETEPHIRKFIEKQLIKEVGQSIKKDILLTRKLQENWSNQYSFIPFDIYALLFSTISLQEVFDPLAVIDQPLFLEELSLEENSNPLNYLNSLEQKQASSTSLTIDAMIK